MNKCELCGGPDALYFSNCDWIPFCKNHTLEEFIEFSLQKERRRFFNSNVWIGSESERQEIAERRKAKTAAKRK